MVTPLNSGRAQEGFCDTFLARHSDYLDGLLQPLEAARMSAHADACASCARYDRVVRKGLLLARELPAIEPATDFDARLQHRLLHLKDAAAADAHSWSVGGVAATLGVAAAIALLAWSPMIMDTGEPAVRAVAAPASTGAAEPAYAAVGAVPLIVESSWYPVTPPDGPAHYAASVMAAFPGPYSPLVVTPPAHRSVRTISTEYVPVD
jgi:anti-sigma factor RsiW